MTERTRFVRLAEPVDVDLKTVGKESLTTLIATGIVNPFGPTLNVVATEGPTPQGRLPILHFTLNPFSQTCSAVGAVELGDEWSPVEDLEPFFSLEFGSCPTLLLPSIFNSPEGNQLVYAGLLREFDNGAEVLSKVERYPGDPWSRVQQDVDGIHLTLTRPAGHHPHKSVGELDHNGALKLARIQLQPANIKAELQAFLAAWDGAIQFQGGGGMAKGAMTLDSFAQWFARFATTCDMPLQSHLA